jgi:hypothetical protein
MPSRAASSPTPSLPTRGRGRHSPTALCAGVPTKVMRTFLSGRKRIWTGKQACQRVPAGTSKCQIWPENSKTDLMVRRIYLILNPLVPKKGLELLCFGSTFRFNEIPLSIEYTSLSIFSIRSTKSTGSIVWYQIPPRLDTTSHDSRSAYGHHGRQEYGTWPESSRKTVAKRYFTLSLAGALKLRLCGSDSNTQANPDFRNLARS